MNKGKKQHYSGSINEMSVNVTEVDISNIRHYKVNISSSGVIKSGYISPPVDMHKSFTDIEKMLVYIKKQTECSNNELSLIRTSIK